jgi:hypothetical protein
MNKGNGDGAPLTYLDYSKFKIQNAILVINDALLFSARATMS